MTDVTHRLELPVAPDDLEVVIARVWAAGALGVWERADGIVAWFSEPVAELPGSGGEAGGNPLSAARWSVEPDRDWQAEWKATIGPIRAGRTLVVPTWLADEHEPEVGQLMLLLDPGRAFGSGHHATTSLCLEVLDELDLAGHLHGATVADVGCGSGILGIAAAARGASVLAVDIDPDAVEVTLENAARNGVELTAQLGSAQQIPSPVDIVVANLVTDVVAQLAADLAAATSGHLIVSGITEERSRVALDPIEAAGIRLEQVRSRDGWIVAVGRPRAD